MAKAALPLGLLTLTAFFGACSPDSFEGADENGIPTMEGIDFSMSVDQEVNQVMLKVPEMKGVYPVWTINGATYSTLNEVGWSNVERGTYPVELRLANRNGISQGCITKYFTFAGSELFINFATSAMGYIHIPLSDNEGNECRSCELFGNSLDRRVHFEGGELATLAGKPVRMSLRMRDADLYSLQFR